MKLKLTQVQRSQLFAGQFPRITGKGKCPYKAGDEFPLSSKLKIVVTGRRQKTDEWTLIYDLHDSRDPLRLLRRTPHAQDFDAIRREFDAHGFPRPLTKDEQKKAARESAYGGHGPGAISDAGEAVDERTQERISKGELRSVSQRQFDEERARERALWRQRPLHEQVRELEEAQAQGLDVSRPLAGIRRRVEAGQRKIKREAA